MSGIIEKIALLGREFTIQTEVVAGSNPRIRTLAYDGGRLVSVREARIEPEDQAEDRLRARVREHHAQITSNLYRRAAELQAAKGGVSPSRQTKAQAPTSAPVAKGRPMPVIEVGSRLEASIATRQAIGPFSIAFARPAPATPEELEPLLAAAEASIDGIMSVPIFSQLRLDEQLTFIALRGQLATWRLSGQDRGVATDVWSNIEPFAHHMQKISDRAELVAFDHELLTWAMSELGKGLVSDRLIEGLRALAGRDAELDQLLAMPAQTTPYGLLDVLMGLLDRTLA